MLPLCSSPTCPGCSASVDPEIGVICDGCERSMHLSCLGLSAEESAAVSRAHRRSGHVKILCADCNNKFKIPLYHHFVNSDIFNKLITDAVQSAVSHESEILKLEIANLRQEVQNLKLSNIDLVRVMSNNVDLSKPCATDSMTKPSYAVISQTKANSKVIIKPKDTKQSVHKTKGDIVHEIDPAKSNVIVKSVKSVSSGGVILTCTDKEADKLKSLATDKLSENYEIKKLATIKPQVRIVGIPAYMDQESAFRSLLKQNDNIFKSNASEYKCIKFWGTKSNKDIFQCIVEVDLDTYRELKSVSGLLVGLNSCSVYDDINVRRCYHCNAFNHVKKYCKYKPTCSFCAGPHELQNCSLDKSKKEFKKCINCSKIKVKPGDNSAANLDLAHAAWEYNSCLAFKNVMNRINKEVFGICQVNSDFLHQH